MSQSSKRRTTPASVAVLLPQRRQEEDYCRYGAPNPEAIRDAARRLNLPADVIVELGDQRFNPAAPSLFSPTSGA